MMPSVQAMLLASVAVKAIAGTRIFNAGYATNTSGPYVTWLTISGIPVADFDRPGFDNARVQFDCFATNATVCDQLASAARDAIELDGENTLLSWRQFPFDPGTGTHRVSMDFSLWIER